jgi:hypothetical protein
LEETLPWRHLHQLRSTLLDTRAYPQAVLVNAWLVPEYLQSKSREQIKLSACMV